ALQAPFQRPARGIGLAPSLDMGRRERAAVIGFLISSAAAVCARAQEPLRIGTVSVEVVDVFSPEEAARGWIYRAADTLHWTKTESVVGPFLLWEEGVLSGPEVRAETERNLRALKFLKSAQVLAGPPHDGQVDVRVVTQDAWTFQLGLSVGSVGGRLIGG